jgi:hypothetical protein
VKHFHFYFNFNFNYNFKFKFINNFSNSIKCFLFCDHYLLILNFIIFLKYPLKFIYCLDKISYFISFLKPNMIYSINYFHLLRSFHFIIIINFLYFFMHLMFIIFLFLIHHIKIISISLFSLQVKPLFLNNLYSIHQYILAINFWETLLLIS